MLMSAGKPTSKTLSEALDLMQLAGGGDKKVRKLIEDMKSVQKNNEAVLAEARQKIKQADEGLENLKAWSDAIKKAEGGVQREREALKKDIRMKNSAFSQRESQLNAREKEINDERAAFESTIKGKYLEFDVKDRELNKKMVELNNRESALVEREAKCAADERFYAELSSKVMSR